MSVGVNQNADNDESQRTSSVSRGNATGEDQAALCGFPCAHDRTNLLQNVRSLI